MLIPRPVRPLALLAAASLLLASAPAAAQTVDLRFSPSLSIVTVGDLVEIQLIALADDIQPLTFSAIDALLAWDPQYLLLVGVDDTLASGSWLASSFLLDPDGINTSLSDGDALYTALVSPGTPGVAQPSGSIITTLQFIALAETPGTPITLLPSLGQYGLTAVYPYDIPGTTITGDISFTATVRIVAAPTAYCFGVPADCPCGNVGGPGEGCANSTGAGGLLSWAGSTSVSADDLVLTASQIASGQFGLFIVGGGQNILPFGDGLRCVVAGPTGLNRFNPPKNSGPGGTFSQGPGIVAHSLANFPLAGQVQVAGTYNFQAWYRDPFAGPCGTGFNLTNGIQLTFTP